MLHVDRFIEDRYPMFARRHHRVARTLARFLGLLFYESRFQQFERDYPHLQGFDFVEETLRYFDFSLRLLSSERARIPATGRVVIAANHPIGSLDGLALLQLVREVRPDVKVVANDILAALEPLRPVMLSVNNMGGSTPRANLRNIHQHLENEGALIIFPAGEVSRFGPKGVKDGTWLSGFVKIACATRSPIQPVYVAGRNSVFFYSLSFLARPLSTLWLVREMFKQGHNTVDARVGKPIPHHIYTAHKVPMPTLAAMFRKHVYRLARNRRPVFQTVETVAAPENRLLLREEVESCEQLGNTPDGKDIYVMQGSSRDCVVREIGRLRELTFRSVGEGTGRPRDMDRYDRDYIHLLLWDRKALEIVGAYRIGRSDEIMRQRGRDGVYTSTLFDFGPGMDAVLEQGLELGRSFVQPDYQQRNSLDYLWYGLGALVLRYPQYRYLFGPVSISRLYSEEAIAHIVHFYQHYHNGDELGVHARQPVYIDPDLWRQVEAGFDGEDRKRDFRRLRDILSGQGLPVPILYKHYSEVAEPAGVRFAAFNLDPDFGDCVDGLIVVDLQQLKPNKKKRYLEQHPPDQDRSDHGSTQPDGNDALPDTVDI